MTEPDEFSRRISDYKLFGMRGNFRLRLTQYDLAERAGVGIRLIRDLEQGKETLKVSTLNKILKLFGKTVGPVDL